MRNDVKYCRSLEVSFDRKEKKMSFFCVERSVETEKNAQRDGIFAEAWRKIRQKVYNFSRCPRYEFLQSDTLIQTMQVAQMMQL